ncbi:N-formylglutamate amidohydrolase [uncultured Altererythrobacter sp.]|uniref:N-formylglutamate amidohydrolase n=1 Tax=uncultured Altererythrobacter sp. TaxID=500840 RepID=UPI0025DC941C|nr:N-formylglutamate amidohydrolase [uncultured Altererythrobacter sp.]
MTTSKRESVGGRMERGGAIPSLDYPSFTLKAPATSPVPVVIAVPHGGRDYPEHVLRAMRDPEFSSLRLEDRLIDEIGVEVAKLTGAVLLEAHAPRAMLDLNRSRDDVDWGMIKGAKPHPIRHSQANRRARSGLGLVPRRLPGFGEIWRQSLTREELDARIEGIHQPYHAALGRELARVRDQWGQALLLDLHSMPPLKPSNGESQMPKFVLGDRFGTSCDASLVNHAYRFLEEKGQVVSHNRPYAGGYVLDTHGAVQNGIHAIQIEVCRSTYLDARQEQLSPKARTLVKMLAGLVQDLGAMTARMMGRGDLRNAAE